VLAINLRQKIKNYISLLKRFWPLNRINQSLFGRYFAACSAVILLCFIFLGTVVTVLSVNYSNNQKRELYSKNASMLATIALNEDAYIHGTMGNNGLADSALDKQLQSYAQIFSPIIAADIYIVTPAGSVIAYSTPNNTDFDDIANITDPTQIKIPSQIMSTIINKKDVHDIGLLGGLYTRQYLTEGVPIADSNGKVIGAVFVSSRADSLISYIYFIIRIFIICIVIVLIFAFVAIYFLTLRLVRPLRQMSVAAKSFAKGDFTIRVPVGDKDEVGQLAVAFNNMASSLTTLEDMRRSFVANVSHELKTPMTSIAGFIDGILDDTIPAEKQGYYLKIVSDEVKRLSRLVRQFLDIARIEAGELKVNPAQFDVDETVRRVIVGFEYAINDKKLEVRGLDEEADIEQMVFADPDLTHQIIYNLVDNAVKFANNGGYIELKVAKLGKKAYVSVKNSGMGIPEKDLPFVFDRFYKTDSSRGLDRKGVGLGLYIAKTVLNLQDEDIVVKSVEGEYCEFVFTLKAV
jgi:signal transduction histidine kinase